MKIMIIDGNSIINRAFYGVRPLTTRDGQFTNAVYGFLTIYFKLLDEVKPDGVCVAFDLKAPTFRHLEFEGYKAKRKGMPDELASQMPILKQVLDAMNITRLESEGYEADDIIGTVSRICSESGDACDIVTGDRDSFQLLENPGTNILLVTTRMGRTETVRYGLNELFEKYALPPEKMRDLKGLMGDASDNIPGVAGIGEKTALDLVRNFGSIEEIYDKLETLDLKESVRSKLIAGRDIAALSKRLATVDTNVPISFTAELVRLKGYNTDALYELLTQLEFKSLIARLGLKQGAPAENKAVERAEYKNLRVETGEKLKELIERCGNAPKIALVVSPGFDGVGISFGDDGATVCRMQFSEAEYREFLIYLFSDKVKKVYHDIKSLMVKLYNEGIECGGFVFDTALGAYLLNPTGHGYALSAVAREYCADIDADENKFSNSEAFSPLTGCDTAVDGLSACARAVGIMEQDMRKRLEDNGMSSLYFDIELPLCRVLADMQNLGFKADRSGLVRFGTELYAQMDKLTKEIFAAAGCEFNILSPKQLGELLFEKLGLPPVKKTKTGYSTDIEVLEKLRGKHEIIPLLIAYRQYSKLKSTYADGLVKEISNKDGRIHSNFQQMITATGRISSTEPNLQNIPIRSELGGEVRKLFIPESEEWVLVDADYSQIELRVLAHIADDPVMRHAFKTGEDIHTITASQVFGVSPDQVDSNMRRAAKAVNFGIVYGISEFSLSEDIGVSRNEAKRYIENYLEKYSGVRAYMLDIVEKAKRDGFVTTLFGRRRSLPELKSSNYNIRSFGERVALNTPIQGTAADIMKIAMLRISDSLKREGLRSRLILQVHDELIVEAHRTEAARVAELLVYEMENACSLSVPLIAEAGMGDTWYDAKK